MTDAGPTDKCIIVAAIDFGTTYSGYALSFKKTPTQIQTNQGWNAGSEKLISHKAPTCVLVKPNKQFDSFGFEAENKYVDLMEDGEHEGWMFFRRFKMILHKGEGLTRESEVEDLNGKRMPAMTIFSMAINFMREDIMELLNNQVMHIKESDVMFVITVPAIWSDASKQFMREAAIAAGIERSHIKLALEPEAASVWCQQVETGEKSAFGKPGSKYMVLDLGGGTVDVSVHEKNLDGTLKELHRASGGPWGGTCVDNSYIDWLAEMFGEDAMEKLKKNVMRDYFDLLREFETKKRNVLPDSTKMINFRVSAALNEFHNEGDGEQITEKIERLNLKNDVKMQRDTLRVSPDIVRSWFKYSIDKSVWHIRKILPEPAMKDVNTILLVGGFAECKLVQEAVKNAVGDRAVIVPEEAGLAVLKGAVLFGHKPQLVSSRCVKYTYGYLSRFPFDESKHPREKMVIDEYGDKRIENCFVKVVEIDTSVEVGKDIPAPGTSALYKTRGTSFTIFASKEQNPTFTTDPSCIKVGTFLLEKASGKTKEENAVQVYFAFGDTELKVSVKMLKTGRVFSTILDCL